MAEPDGMSDRELIAEIYEISCANELRLARLADDLAGLKAKVAELESEFAPVARRYRRLVPALGRAANGRTHGD